VPTLEEVAAETALEVTLTTLVSLSSFFD